MKNTKAVWIIGICLLALGASSTLMGKTDPDENNTPAVLMTNERLYQILKRIDSNVEGKTGFWKFKVDKTTVTLITDQKADRMRIIIPIVKAEALSPEILFRLMQANFDSTVDARYAIAREMLWSAFIHPLSTLSDDELIKGLGQTVNLVLSYGKNYSSGLLIFRGGDSEELRQRELIDNLLER